jgi:hypothetical protein
MFLNFNILDQPRKFTCSHIFQTLIMPGKQLCNIDKFIAVTMMCLVTHINKPYLCHQVNIASFVCEVCEFKCPMSVPYCEKGSEIWKWVRFKIPMEIIILIGFFLLLLLPQWVVIWQCSLSTPLSGVWLPFLGRLECPC